MDPLSSLPSFLEMKMMEEATASARSGMALGLEYMLQRASQTRHPQWRARITRFIEYCIKTYGAELRLVVTYLVNRKCLRSNACATVAESLYGGRRAKLGPVGENGQRSVLSLDDRDKTRLALLLALGPYLQERLEELYQRWKLQAQSQTAACDRNTSMWAKLRAAFVAAYPYLHMTKEGTIIVYQWLFLLGMTLHFDPASHILNQVVRRTTKADVPQSKVGGGDGILATETSLSSTEAVRMDPLRKAILVGLSSTFVLGWLRQFRNLVRAQTQQRQSSIEAIPPPTPLPVKLDQKTRMRPPSMTNPKLCPLCRQPRINPAASSSGYVFCHRCIVMFVREHGKCPITGTACPESRILRVYEPNNI